MIQRIQSVYLLLVAILLVVALCLPVGQFIGSDGIAAHIFKPLGVTLADGNFQSTWGLFGILLLSAIIALCTIFLFRNRMLQVRMTVFGSLSAYGVTRDDTFSVSYGYGLFTGGLGAHYWGGLPPPRHAGSPPSRPTVSPARRHT